MNSETRPNTDLVDEARTRELADEYNLPVIELDAALFGETVQTAHGVLDWIDREERVLTARHGLLQGRRRYKPVKMLRNWAAKHGTGRRKTAHTAANRNP